MFYRNWKMVEFLYKLNLYGGLLLCQKYDWRIQCYKQKENLNRLNIQHEVELECFD